MLPPFEIAADDQEEIEKMSESAKQATAFLKALGHEGRLLILCHLVSGEKSVAVLEKLLDSRQAAVSQQLARLRMEGLVKCRRDGKTMYYSLGDDRVRKMLEVMHDLFCVQTVQASPSS